MTRVDLDQPADLTLWPGHGSARVADDRSFPTLRAALAAAAAAIEVQDAKPWIITQWPAPWKVVLPEVWL